MVGSLKQNNVFNYTNVNEKCDINLSLKNY